MIRFLTHAGQSIQTALVLSGRARACVELLRMSDRTLRDAGFSRTLLEDGVNAWPWRSDVDTKAESDACGIAATHRQAERELQQLSDAELDDLAIARVDIPRAVREGRVGIELPVAAKTDFREAA